MVNGRLKDWRPNFSVRTASGSDRIQHTHRSPIDPVATAQPHTTLVFHLPLLKKIALTIASDEKAIVTARNTPRGPNLKVTASTYASGSSHNQKTNRLMIVGVQVSPAPLND